MILNAKMQVYESYENLLFVKNVQMTFYMCKVLFWYFTNLEIQVSVKIFRMPVCDLSLWTVKIMFILVSIKLILLKNTEVLYIVVIYFVTVHTLLYISIFQSIKSQNHKKW